MKDLQQRVDSLNRYVRIGYVIFLCFIVSSGIASIFVTVDGAVMAPGSIAHNGNIKSVQSLVGGMVSDIHVREGQTVKKGEVLLTLDSTNHQANFKMIITSIAQLLARKARLESEINGELKIAMPTSLLARVESSPEKLLEMEQLILDKKKSALEGQRSQLNERIRQLQEKISGHNVQASTKTEEIGLIEQELDSVQILYDKGMMTLDRLNALSRAAARLRGEKAQLLSSIAEAEGKVTEIRLAKIQLEKNEINDAVEELRDVSAKLEELSQREISAEFSLRQSTVRSPISGVVFDLDVHTIGGVITPAQPIMNIAPENDELIVEARVPDQDVDQISLGQLATLRLLAFDNNVTPEISGEVSRISPDLVHDKLGGESYYRVGIKLKKNDLQKLKLIPGMPVEVYIRTSNRSIASFLIRPLLDHTYRALRDS